MNPIVEFLLGDVPMLQPATVAGWLSPSDRIDGLFARLIEGEVNAQEPMGLRALRADLQDPMTVTPDGIAIVPVRGPMANAPRTLEMLFMGLTDSRAVLDNVKAASRDPAVKGIVLDVNSPGGMHSGGPEIADAVAGAGKPTVAFANGMMASLAYMIGSQADEIVASRSATVGSIGVIMSFMDLSRMLENAGGKVEVITNKEAKFKGAGIAGTALSEAQREYLQGRCDAAFAEFRDLVKSKRPGIPDSAMQGQTFWAKEAKTLGLVDRIGDLEFAVAACRQRVKK